MARGRGVARDGEGNDEWHVQSVDHQHDQDQGLRLPRTGTPGYQGAMGDIPDGAVKAAGGRLDGMTV